MRPCQTCASSSLIIERQTVSNASWANQNSPVLNSSRACSRYRRRSSGAISRRLSANGRQRQQIQRPVATRNSPYQDFNRGARRSRLLDQAVTRPDSVCGKHADAEDLMLAHEHRGPASRSAAGPQPLGEVADGVSHLPGARCPDGGTERRLDAMRGTDPIRERDVASVIRSGTIVGSREVTRYWRHRDRALRPSGPGAAQHPFEHQVRHVWRGDDLVVARLGKETIEKGAPIRLDERAIGRFPELAPRPAIAFAIHYDDGPILSLPARLGLRELRRVERAVAATPDHDDVPQRMSLPPSTTSTVPVT